MLLIQKAFDIREMIQVATEGIKSVVSAMLILSLAYCINAISQTLGTSNYVISVTELDDPVTLLALAFAVCAFMSFFTGTSWGVYAIMIPIVMPLAFNMTGGEATNLGTPPSLLSWAAAASVTTAPPCPTPPFCPLWVQAPTTWITLRLSCPTL